MLPLTFIMVSVQSIDMTWGCDVFSSWVITTRFFVATGGTRLAVHKGRVGLWCCDHFKAEPKARRVPIEDAQQPVSTTTDTTTHRQHSESPAKFWSRTNQNAAVYIMKSSRVCEILHSRLLHTLYPTPPTSYSTAYSKTAPRPSLPMPPNKQSRRPLAQKGGACARSEQRDAGRDHQTVGNKPIFPAGEIHCKNNPIPRRMCRSNFKY